VQRSFFANSGALYRKGVGGFGDDDPGDEVAYGAYAGEDGHKHRDDADDIEVPTIMKREASADTGDNAVVTRAGELPGGCI